MFFYGSIVRVYGNVGRDELYRQLTRILHHEVRHHNEYLAGTDDLGLWDDDHAQALGFQQTTYQRKAGGETLNF